MEERSRVVLKNIAEDIYVLYVFELHSAANCQYGFHCVLYCESKI